MRGTDLSRTIAAIATPIGRGALGVVRLSGPDAIGIADRMFHGQSGRPLSAQPGFTVHLGRANDPATGAPIDEVLATVFRAPRSYTGDDMVEFSTHGGGAVMRRILAVMMQQGAHPAARGEFTLRAFLNGRIDLTQAEAVADIINAKTDAAAQAALENIQGRFHQEILALRAELIAALARLEMGIDFTEEDLEPAELESVGQRLQAVARRIDELLAGYRRGRILRDGFVVVLAGAPNVGKSTLFNRLAQDERAIVTDAPGTTRDILREYINLDGWPVCIIDTAGIRDATDLVERIGVERTTGAIHAADAVIWIVDAGIDWVAQTPPKSFRELAVPWMIAVNKIDARSEASAIVADVAAHHAPRFQRPPTVIGLSAKTGLGIENLITCIKNWIDTVGLTDQSERIAINDRHRDALNRARQAVTQAQESLADRRSPELIAFDANAAAIALGEIIGETTSEDILSEIFANFCVGK